jgi:hypothetical protein
VQAAGGDGPVAMALLAVDDDAHAGWSAPRWPLEARPEAEDGSWWDVEAMRYFRAPGEEPRANVAVRWVLEVGESVVPNRRTHLRPRSQPLESEAEAAARLQPGTPVVAGPEEDILRTFSPSVRWPPQCGFWYDGVIVRARAHSFLVRFADPLPRPVSGERSRLVSAEQWRRDRPAIEPREQWIPWDNICERFDSSAPVRAVAPTSASTTTAVIALDSESESELDTGGGFSSSSSDASDEEYALSQQPPSDTEAGSQPAGRRDRQRRRRQPARRSQEDSGGARAECSEGTSQGPTIQDDDDVVEAEEDHGARSPCDAAAAAAAAAVAAPSRMASKRARRGHRRALQSSQESSQSSQGSSSQLSELEEELMSQASEIVTSGSESGSESDSNDASAKRQRRSGVRATAAAAGADTAAATAGGGAQECSVVCDSGSMDAQHGPSGVVATGSSSSSSSDSDSDSDSGAESGRRRRRRVRTVKLQKCIAPNRNRTQQQQHTAATQDLEDDHALCSTEMVSTVSGEMSDNDILDAPAADTDIATVLSASTDVAEGSSHEDDSQHFDHSDGLVDVSSTPDGENEPYEHQSEEQATAAAAAAAAAEEEEEEGEE